MRANVVFFLTQKIFYTFILYNNVKNKYKT